MIVQFLGALRRYFALLVVLAVFGWSAFTIAIRRVEEDPPDTITLRFGHWQLESGVRDGINALAAEYQQVWRKQWEGGGKNSEGRPWRKLYPDKPKVRIIQDAIPETTYGQWVSTQLMGGTAPDIMEIWLGLPYPIWLSYLNRYFIPLTPYVHRPNPHNAGTELGPVPLGKTYKDGMRGAYVEELQAYMTIPVSQFAVRIFYNKDLLKKLTGLDKAPGDYRGFLGVCEKIGSQKNALGKAYTPIAASAYHFNMWESMLFDVVTYGALRRIDFNRDTYGGNDEIYTGFRSGRLSFNFPPYRAKFRMVREVTQHFQNGYTGLNRDDAVFLFAQQRAVFITTGTWDARSLQEQAKGKFAVGVMDFPLPSTSDPDYGPFIEGPIYERPGSSACFGITRTCKYQDVAVDFLLFLASKRGNEKLNEYFGWIPAIVNTKKDPILEGFEPHLVGVYGVMNLNLGGETYIKWMQVYSKYKVDRNYSFEAMARDFEPFYKERGQRDFEELQKDWRRGLQNTEQFLVGIRSRAMTAEGDQARTEWIKYRALTASRQVWPEITHARQMNLVGIGPAPDAVGPYEYSPAVLEKIRTRLSRERGKSQP